MRTFIAVRIAATFAIQSVLAELSGMKPAVRPVPEDQLHVTLKFLGETDETQLPDLLEIMADIAQREHAHPLVLKGMGAFPDTEHPTVLWLGFEDPQLLVRLEIDLEEQCRLIGFESERRPFQPHLTLARIKSEPPRRLAGLLRNHRETVFGSSPLARLELFRSDPGSNGPVYTVIGSAPLSPA